MTTPTAEQLADIHERGYRDGLNGLPLPEVLDDAFVEAYAAGRRIGTQRSGRVVPRTPLFDSPFCRAVLARPFEPALGPSLPCVGDVAEVPSPSSEAA